MNCDKTACRRQVNYLPSKQGLNETHVVITHLSSFVRYEFRIYAKNRVSEVAQEMHGIEASFTLHRVTTKASIPSKVQVSFQQLSGAAVRISWRLESTNGRLVAYYLTYTRLDDEKDSKTIKTTKTEVILTGLKLGKTYSFVEVILVLGKTDPLLLILEYMPYGDLLGYLRISRGHHDIYNSGEKKPTSRLTDTDLLSFACMIADGMSYLADMRTYIDLDVYNDRDYVNFDMVDELQ
ncbi:Ephrin type-A receptor 5 [Acropora cervicornis]|uniref:Ephrin type-A receptor 5 n=1 Tax=Acropora cervicornis TaxID=6130 RepID=A0AAD9USD9_ACRCE|nr:Ephrin type-A receptor 5 [Acropora cervicornis]